MASSTHQAKIRSVSLRECVVCCCNGYKVWGDGRPKNRVYEKGVRCSYLAGLWWSAVLGGQTEVTEADTISGHQLCNG